MGVLRRTGQWPDLAWWVALGGAIALLLMLNPNGFIGGGQDDWQYLNAARCWRDHGPCLPYDHWQGRWPVVAPIAASTALFGESRLSVSIAPFIASVIAVGLLAIIVNRLFWRPIGWIASLLFLCIAAFTFQFTQPSVEAIELVFVFGGFLAILQWQCERKGLWALVAGLAFALAFQARETAVVAVLFAFAYVISRRPAPKPAHILWAGFGFAIPLAIEFVTFALATGDPFWRRELSVRHTRIPSSELLVDVDPSKLPFFNKELIANWRMQPGIHIHWAIDGFANLLVNAFAGLSLLAVPLIAVFPKSGISNEARWDAMKLWLTAVLYMAVLIFGLALDPKPRVMLIPLAMITAAFALLTWQLHECGRKAVAYSIWFAGSILVLPLQVAHQRTDSVEPAAAEWIRNRPGQVEIDSNTRRLLALVPSAEALPDLRAERPYLLYMSITDCHRWLAQGTVPSGTFDVVEQASVSKLAPLDSRLRAELCLLRYKRSVPAEKIRKQIRWQKNVTG